MRAVVADEWAVLRSGVVAVLARCGIDVVRETSSATPALGELRPGGPELFVVGLVSDQSLVGAVRRAKTIDPAVRAIVLAASVDRSAVLALLDGGADAVLSRDAGEDEVLDAIARVNRGQLFVTPGLLETLFGDVRSVNDDAAGATMLTDREQAVLGLLVEGNSNREIAKKLYIGEATVKTHLHHLYEKLEVANRVQAVGRAIELRLVR